MKIVSIFADRLYAIQYCDDTKIDKHELALLFDHWNDAEFLFNFFNENEKDLASPVWDYISVEDAIDKTIDEALELENWFTDCNTIRKFRPLFNIALPEDYEKSKLYGTKIPSWLRVYAIRIDTDCYIITGGAIKLTRSMNDRSHTTEELNKLERVKNFLKEERICDSIGINDFIEIY